MPDHIFKKILWRSTVGLSVPMEQATTWSLTGIAAIVALLISNLDSVADLVSRGGLRWSIWLFTASLVFGALSKQIGMAVASGLEMVRELEGALTSPKGQELMDAMALSPEQMVNETAQPFWWPLSALMRRGGRLGIKDPLSADKRFINLFCWQLALVYLHGATAAAGIVAVAASIKE